MVFRAVIYSVDHTIHIVYPKISGNWFDFNGRSYRVDRNAVRQVLNKGLKIRNFVESIYFEGNPIPKFSKMKKEKVLQELWDLMVAKTGNKPTKGFWIFGK